MAASAERFLPGRTITAAIALIVSLSLRGGVAPRPSTSGGVAIENVAVVHVDPPHIVPGHTVVIKGDRIERVDSAPPVTTGPDGLRVDGRGRSVRGRWLDAADLRSTIERQAGRFE